MVVTASDLSDAGIERPCSSAAPRSPTSSRAAASRPRTTGTVVYCNDAMNGLATMNALMDPEQRIQLEAELLERGTANRARPSALPPETETAAPASRSTRAIAAARHRPPTLEITGVPKTHHLATAERAFAERVSLDTIWSYINPQMLYGKHLGFRGRFTEALARGDVKAKELRGADRRREGRVPRRRDDRPRRLAVLRGRVRRQHAAPLRTRRRPARSQTSRSRASAKPTASALRDFVLPPRIARRAAAVRRQRDHVALFVTTAGEGINERAEAREAARRVRQLVRAAGARARDRRGRRRVAAQPPPRRLGLPRRPDVADARSCSRRTTAARRYSFGYPACPDLEQQAKLFHLLRPEESGVELTEGFMMEPEASVSALVFHHPDAAYFSTGPADD